MAAITASGNGLRVALIDRNPQLGRKLLATGNGRCNLTNAHVTPAHYHGGSPELIRAVLSRFDQHAALRFFQDLGLLVHEEDNGRMFPRTNQASSVVEVLRQRLSRNHVDVFLEAQVVGIEDTPRGWGILLKSEDTLQAGKLILATGGRAAHYLGSTGDGLYWAQKLGHTLTAIHAALVPIETVEPWPKQAQGIKVEAAVWATSGERKIGESSGDVLFTSYGVSGPAVMAQAGGIAPLLKTSTVLLHIDLFPDMTGAQLDQAVLRVFQIDGGRPLKDALAGLLPAGLIPVVLQVAGLEETAQTGAVPDDARLRLVGILKNLTLTVSKLRPLKEAQVTAGGLSSAEIDARTLQSRIARGLYFAGEMLDADGDSGGFNLQWAWSSGYVAGLLQE